MSKSMHSLLLFLSGGCLLLEGEFKTGVVCSDAPFVNCVAKDGNDTLCGGVIFSHDEKLVDCNTTSTITTAYPW